MYELNTEKFSGPMEKLLELIEGRKMEITELNLAAITADFLAYLEQLKAAENEQNNLSPRMLADFLVIAASLLLIKSKALLPEIELTEEEERGISDLETRLKFYQNFKPAIVYLKTLSEKKSLSVSRPLFLGRQAFFYPASNVGIEDLRNSIGNIIEAVKRFSPEEAVAQKTLISLEEKIAEIIGRFGEAAKRQNFGELIKNKSRSEIIVAFLAILHLIERQIVLAEQNNRFSDIIINKV